MKRSLFIAIVVLLMAALFVSCNAEKSLEDQLVEVTIAGGARALSATGTMNVDVDDFVWYYTATKKAGMFKEGQTNGLTAVPLEQGRETGITGASLGSMSTGGWRFCFYGYAVGTTPDASAPKTNAIYYQENLDVAISAATNVLNITLERGSAALSDAVVKFANDLTWTASNNLVTGDVKLYILVDDVENQIIVGSANGNVVTFDKDNINDITLTAGNKKLKFDVYNEYEFAGTAFTDYVGSALLTIAATPGMQYSVSCDENGIGVVETGSSQEVTIGTATAPTISSEVVTISSEASVTVTTKNAPGATKSTSVTFPANSLSTTTDHNLRVETSPAEVASAKFQAQAGDNEVVASLDFTIDNAESTDFGTFAVTVTTYIAAGLDNVAVLYSGSGDNPVASADATHATDGVADIYETDNALGENVGYSQESGKLVFTTTHFSEFYVVVSGEAKIGTKVYSSFAAAVAAAKDNQVVTLLKDISLSAQINIAKSIIIDLNDYDISAIDSRALNIVSGDVSIIGEGTISSSKTQGSSFTSGYSVIRVGSGFYATDAVNPKASLTVGKDVTVSSDFCYGITVFGTNVGTNEIGQSLIVDGKVIVTGSEAAISGNGTSNLSKTAITLNDGAVVSSANDYAIYHPQAGTFTVNGATITGLGGVELKSGSVAVIEDNAIITATGTVSHEKNNDGTSTSGYAIAAVENSGYKGGAQVTISSGSFTGPIAIIEDDTVAASEKASISISGGSFSDPSVFDYLADGASIKLLDDIVVDSAIEITKSVTIDGNNHFVSVGNGDSKRVFNVNDCTNDMIITFQNIEIRGPESGSYTRGISLYGNTGKVVLNIKNAIVSANYYAINVASANSDITVNVTDSSFAAGWCAIQTWSANSVFNIKDSILSGVNDKTYAASGDNDFSTIVFNEPATGAKATFERCNIYATQTTGNNQTLVSYRATDVVNTFTDCHFFVDNVEITDIDTLFENINFENWDAVYSLTAIIDGETVELN